MLAKDDMTGVYDRPTILDRFEAAIRDTGSLTVIFMDFDHLMRFNEQYGFQAGDEWIKSVVQMFVDAFGQDDLVGRYGGDEFVAGVKASDLNRLKSIFETTEELARKVKENGPIINGERVSGDYSVAFGVAAYPRNARDTVDLVEKAKEALYRAKESGGGQVCFYEDKDSMTGLLNFYGGLRALEEAIAQAKAKRGCLSVILYDLDKFASINEEYGHRAGDEVLKRAATLLQNNLKDVGVLVRSAGDEFMVILPGQLADSAFVLADEVRKAAENSEIPVSIGGKQTMLRFTLTGGVATYPNDGSDRIDLLRKADEALYRAKRTGRNRICLPASGQMVTKTSHYTQTQLERLAETAKKLDKSEAFLLREALDDLLRKYSDE